MCRVVAVDFFNGPIILFIIVTKNIFKLELIKLKALISRVTHIIYGQYEKY